MHRSLNDSLTWIGCRSVAAMIFASERAHAVLADRIESVVHRVTSKLTPPSSWVADNS